MEKSSADEGSPDQVERAAGADYVSAAPADKPLEDQESSTANGSSASDGEGSHKSDNSGSVKDHGSDSIEGNKSKKDRIKGKDDILAECSYKDYSQVPPELSNDQELNAKKHLPAKEVSTANQSKDFFGVFEIIGPRQDRQNSLYHIRLLNLRTSSSRRR